MNNRKMLCVFWSTIFILLWTGCGVNSFMKDKVKCTIESGELLTIHYKEKDYIVLAEEISANEIGEWVGYIYRNVSGVMFTTVYLDKEDENMINVAADNLFYRAIEKDKLTEEQKVLTILCSIKEKPANGQQEILVNSKDVTQIIFQNKVYQITKRKVDKESLGEFIATLARYVIYDTETLTEIEKEEYTKMDWDGGDKQGRAVRVYGNVYYMKNTEELGVEVNGVYYMAINVKE